MFKSNFCLVNLFLLLFINSKNLHSQDTIILGKAYNAKNGAIVVTSHETVYYIDNMKEWSPDFYEKPIKVIGKVVIKKLKKLKPGYAGFTGTEIKIIKNAKIQVVPDS